MRITVRLIVGTQHGILAEEHDGLYGFISVAGVGETPDSWKPIAIAGLEKRTGIPSSSGHYKGLAIVKSKKLNKRNKPKRLLVTARVMLKDSHILGNLAPPASAGAAKPLQEVWYDDMSKPHFNPTDLLTLLEFDLFKPQKLRHAD
ncbi:hypothetical protein KKD81_03150 [Patescibacteria group bacterium]|nr:hypothetical protein [Patescibacteria group bacterium]MBU2159120.1 hypothetical protein [Patescibacteria group bacterium]MBU2220907.1 hypothetical protein [Patescibacteria group bacterium]